VFAKGSAGLGVLLGPTGGYLLGFVCAAFVTGLLGTLVRRVTRNADWWRVSGYIIAALLGLVSIYLVGTLRLALSLQISMPKAFAVGVLPFMAADLVKTIAAASFVIALERRGLRPS
jgi:biotin transport system substrate-specific component